MIKKEETKLRPIYEIAKDIDNEWGGKIYFGARPYLCAMFELENIHGKYGADDCSTILAYFLSNSSTFKGGNAKALKNELKAHLQSH